MSRKPSRWSPSRGPRARRAYPEEFKRAAVQMLLDGHSASTLSVRDIGCRSRLNGLLKHYYRKAA